MARTQKETTFEGKLYDQKDRQGNRYLVLDTAEWLAILNSAAVGSASTVAELVTALIAGVTDAT